jgi:SAM-dependent methyltransferase
MSDADKLFRRAEYRRVIAWPERIRREAPFLESVLADAPAQTLLDVGCGTGEHARHFAERGWDVVGIDLSEKMIEDARDHEGRTDAGGSMRCELRDAADAAGLPEAPFGAAICLGNAFAFIDGEASLARFLSGVAGALRPGALFLVQLLNYERIEECGIRTLGVNVRPLPDDEGPGDIVWLRIFRPRSDGSLAFFSVTLTLAPGEDPPAHVRSANEGTHHPWKRARLETAFAAAGFCDLRILGGMGNIPYEATGSTDLVIVARRG